MSASILFLCVGAFSETAHSQAVELCTLAQVDRDPLSVIEPCSLVIESTAADASRRGFALYIRGKGYHNTKRFDLARQDYDAAIKLTPTTEELLVSRANISFRSRRMEEGVSFLQKALDVNPSNGHALRTMGALLEDSGRPEEASRCYTRALEADPKDAYALLFRSRNYTRRMLFDEALKDADALVSIPAREINLQGYLDELGDKQDFHVIALLNRAKLEGAMDRADLAEVDFKAAIDFSPSDQTFSARGKFLTYRPGREVDAMRDLDEATRLGSRDSRTHYAKGMLLHRKKQYREALAAFDEAVKIDPDFGEALQMRARTHREFDETEAALADIARAIAVSPHVRDVTLTSLRQAGYWRTADDPDSFTPELVDALRACMVDRTCN
jgi:tetratricopeptide (TPR) repeat protein